MPLGSGITFKHTSGKVFYGCVSNKVMQLAKEMAVGWYTEISAFDKPPSHSVHVDEQELALPLALGGCGLHLLRIFAETRSTVALGPIGHRLLRVF